MRKIIGLCIFLVGFLSFEIHAAAPVTHIVLAERYLKTLPQPLSTEDKKLFMLGTLFPDIRYIGVINRKESHFKNITLEKVNAQTDPFHRGVLFHSYVDEARDKYVRRVGIQNSLTDVPKNMQRNFLKILEDQILFDQNNWGDIRGYLVTIPEDEKRYDIDMQSLTKWHAGLTLYFTAQPSSLLTHISLFDVGILSLDPKAVKLWSDLLPKYAADPAMKEYVAGLVQLFDKSYLTT